MARPTHERIAELRKEIAQIQAADRLESSTLPYHERGARKERRAERLQEIMAELRAMSDKTP